MEGFSQDLQPQYAVVFIGCSGRKEGKPYAFHGFMVIEDQPISQD
jgi:hypothetical protein